MLRPQPARWFEILVVRDDALLTLESLARTGAVELEARQSVALPVVLEEVRPLLHEFAEIAIRYRAYWPRHDCASSPFPEPPRVTLERCLTRVRSWAREAEPLIRQTQRHEAERAEISLWSEVLEAIGDARFDMSLLAGAGPTLRVGLFAYPAGGGPLFPPGALTRVLELGTGPHALLVGTTQQLQSLASEVLAMAGRVRSAPTWLRPDLAGNRAWVARRLSEIDAALTRIGSALDRLHHRHDLRRVLGDANRLQWVLDNVHALDTSDLFCWITGWSSDFDGDSLARALERAGARALLHFPPPPPSAQPPLLFRNPAWARPFEVFSRALGMPSNSEADPSRLLAVVVPLMFGYMFGDVGQGLVLAATAWWLRERFVFARLLVAGGLSAALFGVLFGSVFSLSTVLPAAWLHPLDEPLAVLVFPVAGGAVMLTAGLLLGGLEAAWRGQSRHWLLAQAWLIVVYLGTLAAVFDTRALFAAAAGALAWCVGHGLREGRPGAAFTALAGLVEKTLQVLVNTVSFARIGAFALAHAGLSSAIVALVDTAEDPAARVLILVIGNAVVLVLEVMIVSIQTTRLVLFEFFTRFLVGTGRAFRPLQPPPCVSQEH